MPTNATDIFEIVLKHCPIALVQAWVKPLPKSSGARSGTRNPEQLMADLLRRFSMEQLRTAGVLAPRRDGAADTLHPDLASPEKKFVLLRSGNRPLDLVLNTGCAGQKGPAVLGVSRDQDFQAALEKVHSIFITSSIEDLILLRAHGLPASTA